MPRLVTFRTARCREGLPDLLDDVGGGQVGRGDPCVTLVATRANRGDWTYLGVYT